MRSEFFVIMNVKFFEKGVDENPIANLKDREDDSFRAFEPKFVAGDCVAKSDREDVLELANVRDSNEFGFPVLLASMDIMQQ